MYFSSSFSGLSVVTEKRVQNITLNFGPQHPAAHGVLRLVLTLDGEVSWHGYMIVLSTNNLMK